MHFSLQMRQNFISFSRTEIMNKRIEEERRSRETLQELEDRIKKVGFCSFFLSFFCLNWQLPRVWIWIEPFQPQRARCVIDLVPLCSQLLAASALKGEQLVERERERERERGGRERERERENSELYYTRIKILGSCLFLQSVPLANLRANRLHIKQ